MAEEKFSARELCEMKKICIILCITVIIMSHFSVFAMEPEISVEESKVGFMTSAPVFLMPAERDVTKVTVAESKFIMPEGASVDLFVEEEVLTDKYIPDIMEQIDIISVSPRE